jgi:diguanylate cyclase (GGDEF)-like protein
MTQIEAELARIQRSGSHPAAVLMCDLDHFKAINDEWGHAIGDLALRHFSSILREQLRRSDIVGRVGGEEFAVVLSGTGIDDAIAFARRVQQRLTQNPLPQGDQRIALSISVGIAALSAIDSNVDGALSRSDMALYRAKSEGRNRIEWG